MHRFYEAYDSHSDDLTYRELLLTDAESTSEAVKVFRPPSWALCTMRLESRFANLEDARQNPDGNDLLQLASPVGLGVYRYDRIVIVQRGEEDRIETLVAFFTSWLPSVITQKRLFLSRIPRVFTSEDVERSVGAARPLDAGYPNEMPG